MPLVALLDYPEKARLGTDPVVRPEDDSGLERRWRQMKKQEIAAWVIGGTLLGGAIGWSAARASRNSTAVNPVNSPVAATTPLVPEVPSLDTVPRIGLADFRKQLEREEIVAIDVRDIDAYTTAHIPGAMHIPLSFIEGELPYLPRRRTIVTYCT